MTNRGFTAENAKERGAAGGRASAESRRAHKALAADLKARKKFEDAAEQLADKLLDAALGRGQFDGLDPSEQAKYVIKALEYGLGRPRQLDRQEPDEPQDVPSDGVSFGVVDPPDTEPAEDTE